MNVEPTVLIVPSERSSSKLVELLEKQKLFLEFADVDEVDGSLPLVSPDLVIYFGHERASELVEILAKTKKDERVRLAFVAERKALAELRKLDRDLVVTVLSLDIPETALASRLTTVARRVAQKAEAQRSARPPALEKTPKSASQAPSKTPAKPAAKPALPKPTAQPVLPEPAPAKPAPPKPTAKPPLPKPTASPVPPRTLSKAAPRLAVEAAPKEPSKTSAAEEKAELDTAKPGESLVLGELIPDSTATPASPATPAPSIKARPKASVPPSVSIPLTPSPTHAAGSLQPSGPEASSSGERLHRIVLADSDVTRAAALVEALAERGLRVLAVPTDPSTTRWPLLRSLDPDGLIADGRALRGEAKVWLQLFQADEALKRARVVAVPLERLFDEASGTVNLHLVEPHLGNAEDERATLVHDISEEIDRPTLAHDSGSDALALASPRPAAGQPALAAGEPGEHAPSSHAMTKEHDLSDLAGTFGLETSEHTAIDPGSIDLSSVAPPGQVSALKSVSPPTPGVAPASAERAAAHRNLRMPLLIGGALVTALVVAAGWFFTVGPGAKPDEAPALAHARAEAAAKKKEAAEAAAEAAAKDEEDAADAAAQAEKKEIESIWVLPAAEAPACSDLVEAPEEVNGVTISVGSQAWKRARRLLVLGDMEGAHRSLCEAVVNNPQSLALEGLAVHYLTLHAPEQAKVWADKAIAIRPKRRKTRELMGDIESQRGNESAAREIWLTELQVAADDTKTIEAVASRFSKDALVTLRSGDKAQAEWLSRRAATLDSKSARAAAALAATFLAFEAVEQAERWVNRALELDPEAAEALVVQGDIQVSRGDTEGARKSFKKATELAPTNKGAWQKLGSLG